MSTTTLHTCPASLFVPHGAPTFALRPGAAGAALVAKAASLALPRAFVVYQAEPMAGTATMDEEMSRLGEIDLERTALVSDGRPLKEWQDPTAAEVTGLSPNRVEVRASLEAPGLLVLSEIWYPGWQARDNGQATPIVRADAILRGVYLEAGAHTVEFVYRPWTVQAGLIVSGATALALAGYAAMRLLRRKWQGATAWKVR